MSCINEERPETVGGQRAVHLNEVTMKAAQQASPWKVSRAQPPFIVRSKDSYLHTGSLLLPCSDLQDFRCCLLDEGLGDLSQHAEQNKISLVHQWGGGEVASADGIRCGVPVRTLHAGPNPKYFGFERGVTYYNLLSSQFTGLNAIVVPGTLRDSLFLLYVVLEQQTELQPPTIHPKAFRWDSATALLLTKGGKSNTRIQQGSE